MIELRNISKEFINGKNNTVALKNINLEINDIGLTFILGRSGSGKTTLLNLIGGLDRPTSGQILVNKFEISKYSDKKMDEFRNKNIGFIFQSSEMIPHLTLLENICVPLLVTKTKKSEIIKRANNLIIKLGLENEKNKYPNQVSGGQKQRAAIARALITNPKIILADEPTGALDSYNSKIVMDYLKEISKDIKVIMVTHNEELVNIYADQLIKLSDGEIIENRQINNDNKEIKEINKSRFNFVSFYASLKLGFRHLLSKKIRTIITIIASSIGIVSTCLVILVSNSMNTYTEYAQKAALGSYPITITSNVSSDDVESDSTTYTAYPNSNVINITDNYQSLYSHINVFSNDYLDYIKNMDKSLYSVIDYGTSLNMHVLSYCEESYQYLSSSSYLKQIESDSSYLKDEYDLLYGENYPSSKGELALVIDKNNCIDAYVLDYLGIDYKNKKEYTFEEICNKEFKVILNNDYYTYDEDSGRYLISGNRENLYNNSTLTLKITCVLRIKSSATTKMYNTGILYTSDLFDYVHSNCIESDIVKAQLANGMSKNVFTGKEFVDSVGDFQTITKEYTYENVLRTIGYYYSISYIKIYTDKFENRKLINDYLEDYNIGKELDSQVIYRDYMGSITEEFSKFVTILRNVLIIFSAISLIVSCIMISLLMYVSVMERINEIGLLRSVGYSKPNVSLIYISEGGLIGFSSGVIGLAAAITLIKPILKFVSNIVEEAYSTDFDISTITKVQLNIFQVFGIIIGSVLISVIASLIPAIIAASKDPVKAISYQGD